MNKLRASVILFLVSLLLAGCSHRPQELSERPWNRQTKADISTGWLRVGNDEQAESWRKAPYP